MKVLQVNKFYSPFIGGVEKHVQDLAESLLGKVDVEVLVANTKHQKIKEKVNGVSVTRIPSWGIVKSAPVAPGFYRAFKQIPADIYNLHFPNPFGEIGYLAAGAPGKLAVTYHSDVVRQKTLLRFYSPIIKKLLKRADVIFVSSPNMIGTSPWLQPVKEKCLVVPFGIDAAPFRINDKVSSGAAAIRQKYGSPLVLFLGRLIYYKGLKYLVEAMRTIDAHLLIVGTGVLEEELRSQVEKLGIGERVHFIGEAADAELPAYFHACDIFVLPSIANSEAFGFVQLEAHACGKPVVSTNLPTGVPYANLNGVTGLIVPPKDSVALANAINRLLKDNVLREKLGSQAKARVENDFSREALSDAVLDIYKRM